MSSGEGGTVDHRNEEEGNPHKVKESELSERETTPGGDCSRLSDNEENSEKRCTSASGAGESEYESVDGGNDDDEDEDMKDAIEDEPPSTNAVDEDTSISSTGVSNSSCQPHVTVKDESSAGQQNDSTLSPADKLPLSPSLDLKDVPKSESSIKKPLPPPATVSWADATEEQFEINASEEVQSSQPVAETEDKKTTEPQHQSIKQHSPDDEDDNYEDVDSEVSDHSNDDNESEDIEDAEDDIEGDEEDDVDEEEDIESEEENVAPEEPKKPLDDDEDKRKPQYIPKRGAFYEHDDRLGSEETEVDIKDEKKSSSQEILKIGSITSKITETVTPTLHIEEKADESGRKVRRTDQRPTREVYKVTRNMDADRWGHDMFKDEDQKPKSREELMSSYGYDIREADSAPQSGGPRRIRKDRPIREGKFTRKNRISEPSKSRPRSKETTTDTKVVNNAATSRAAIDKIAMREAHQANEKKRYDLEERDRMGGFRDRQRNRMEREKKRSEGEVRDRVADNNRKNQEYSRRDRNRDYYEDNNRRPQQQPQSRYNKESKAQQPFSREDFPELSATTSTTKEIRKTATSSAWTRNTTSNQDNIPILKTHVVYSSSRYSNRSQANDSNYNTGGSFGGKKIDRDFDRGREGKAPSSEKIPSERQYQQQPSTQQQSQQYTRRPSRDSGHQQQPDHPRIQQQASQVDSGRHVERRDSREYQQPENRNQRIDRGERGSAIRNSPTQNRRGREFRQQVPQGGKLQTPQGYHQQTHQYPDQPGGYHDHHHSDYSSHQQQSLEEVTATLVKMSMVEQQQQPQSISNSSRQGNSSSDQQQGDLSLSEDVQGGNRPPKRYSAIRQQQQQVVSRSDGMVTQPPPPMAALPPHTTYYTTHDPTAATHTPPEYYQDPDTTPYTAYAPEAAGGYHHMAHVSETAHHHHPHMTQRFIPAGHHPASPATLTMAPPPPPPTAFLPTFTPSLPPSGFPQYPPPATYQSFAPPPGPVPPGTGGPVVGPVPPTTGVGTGGITYYDPSQQQHTLRSLPPKRPKNIIPIVPPPRADGGSGTHTHTQGQVVVEQAAGD